MQKKSKNWQNIWKKTKKALGIVGKHSKKVGEHLEEVGEGIEVKIVRGKDDKRTHIDESKEGPVQGFYIGSKKAVAEDVETDGEDVVAPERPYVWWKDVRFVLPTIIGVTSIIVSVILWLLS